MLLQPLWWDADCSHHEGGEEWVMGDTSIGAPGLLEALMMCPIQRVADSGLNAFCCVVLFSLYNNPVRRWRILIDR